MSGTTPFGLPITTPQPLSPQGFLGQGNLLQSNTTLLQPVTGTFRLFDMFWLMMLTSGTAAPAIAELGADVAQTDAWIEDQIVLLQQQIDSLNARLTHAGIA